MEQEGHNQIPIATLLRLAADGELSAEQEAALRAHLEVHPEDRDRVEFDRKLREACGCACAPECCAPESLRRKVLACCTATEPDPGEQRAGRPEQTRTRGFWTAGVLTRLGTIAAVVALVGVVAFMVVRSTLPRGPVVTPGVRTVEERISHFVRAEHDRCAGGVPEVSEKFTIQDPTALPGAFESIVGHRFSLESVLNSDAHGLRFVDAGRCYPPGGDAIHIRFVTDDDDAIPVSLWIQMDDDSLPLEDGVAYTDSEEGECVRFWRLEGVRYVLVCSRAQAGPVASLALHCPETTRPF